MSDSRVPLPSRAERGAARRRAKDKHRVLVSSLASAALIIGVATASSVSSYHSVTLEVDGVTTPAAGFYRSVGDVLSAAGVETGDHDLVAPAPASPASDGISIIVRHARPHTATNGDRTIEVWSTADSIRELAQSVTDSGQAQAIPTRGEARTEIPLVADTETVTILSDGEETHIDATPRDSAQTLLTKAGIDASPNDRIHATLDRTTLTLTLTRVDRGTRVHVDSTPHSTHRHEDPTLPTGQEEIVQQGADGETRTTVWEERVDGQVTHRAVESVETTAPITEEIAVGTKQPDPAEGVGPTQTPSTQVQDLAFGMLAERGWAQQWDAFNALVARESGWSVTASNPSGAYGLPQALPGSKMSSHGSDWATNPRTQLAWMMDYIAGRYGSPQAAWAHSQNTGWY